MKFNMFTLGSQDTNQGNSPQKIWKLWWIFSWKRPANKSQVYEYNGSGGMKFVSVCMCLRRNEVAWNLFLCAWNLYACACGRMQRYEIYFCVHASAAKCGKMQIIYVCMRTRRKRQNFDECVFHEFSNLINTNWGLLCWVLWEFCDFLKLLCNEIQVQIALLCFMSRF